MSSTPKRDLSWQNKTIILASKSPRRSQLLTAAGIPFRIQTTEVEETFPEDLPIDDVAVYLAEKKALAAQNFILDQEIILAADSIVVLDNKIYGKPVDYEDAVNTLQQLSGSIHRVITGVCLLSRDKKRSFSGLSKVHFAELNLEEIDYYLKEYQPYDKAGAYAIQEWIGLCKIRHIEGTYSNIMGLPMELVFRELARF